MRFLFLVPILGVSLFTNSPARAQSSPLAAFLGAGGPPRPVVTIEGRFVNAPADSPSIVEDRVSLIVPAYRGPRHVVTPSLSVGHLSFGRNLVLSSGRRVPRDLARLELGTQYTHPLDGGRNWGLRATVGYAGDKPFRANEDLAFSVGATYGYPGKSSGYWVLMVLLGNNGPLPNYVPLPGFLYVYRSPTFSGVFGLPILSMTWTPRPRWSLNASAFGPLVRAELAHGEPNHPQTFVGYAYAPQFFIPDVRDRAKDRLTVQEQRAAVGVRAPLGSRFTTEAQGGLAYDRSVYVGRSIGNKKGGSAALPKDWFVTWQIGATF